MSRPPKYTFNMCCVTCMFSLCVSTQGKECHNNYSVVPVNMDL